jgi:signal transduction histidine kinase
MLASMSSLSASGRSVTPAAYERRRSGSSRWRAVFPITLWGERGRRPSHHGVTGNVLTWVTRSRAGWPENDAVSQLRTRAEEVLGAAGRVAGSREWPVFAAGVLALLAVVEVIERADPAASYPSGPALPTTLLLALGSTLPAALARTYVLAAAATTTLAATLTLATGLPLTAAGVVALTAALYLVGRHRSRWVAALLVLPFALHTAVPDLTFGPRSRDVACATKVPLSRGATDCERGLDGTVAGGLGCPPEQVALRDSTGLALACGPVPADPVTRLPSILLLALLAAAPMAGWARRRRGELAIQDASSRAVADSLLEHAARGARARIARELHDVVAHHISLIAVQAEAARLTTTGMPTEGAKRLVAIGDTAREALTEMRRLLGVLREDAGTEPTRTPQPGVAQLIDLVDDARESGPAGVRLIVRGRSLPLDPGVELTAYRIVQEALTNARRHAPGAAVDVELHYTSDALRLRVRDNGPGPPDVAGNGFGLPGMRERAAMVGGTLHAGPARANGFLVEAVLPVATEARP